MSVSAWMLALPRPAVWMAPLAATVTVVAGRPDAPAPSWLCARMPTAPSPRVVRVWPAAKVTLTGPPAEPPPPRLSAWMPVEPWPWVTRPLERLTLTAPPAPFSEVLSAYTPCAWAPWVEIAAVELTDTAPPAPTSLWLWA